VYTISMKLSLPTLAVACLVLVMAPHANADSVAGPWSYRIVSADGRFVFVMLAPGTSDPRWGGDMGKEIRAVREKYKQSGLYRNDGSDIPIWTLDWYSHSIEIASDGVHLIRKHTGPSYDRNDTSPRRYEQEALSFFANGKLLRTYRIDEIVSNPTSLPHSVSHFQWFARDELDDAKLHYKVWTIEGIGGGPRWVDFDLTSGELVASSPGVPASESVASLLSSNRAIWIVPIGLLLLGFGAWIFRRKRSNYEF
jgi:LPXTG-motif cell wall-anchored protein